MDRDRGQYDNMSVDLSLANLEAIESLRKLYRKEMNCHIVHDCLHARFFTDIYIIRVDDRLAGYGCLSSDESERRDVIKEYYVLPAYRQIALPIFRLFAALTLATAVEAQTNDTLLSLMLFDCATEITSERILFCDAAATQFTHPEVIFREVTLADRDRMFPHKLEGAGDWLLELGGAIVATGGIYAHFNPPYAEIAMEVDEPFWRRGFGSYLVQELKRTCYELGRIPTSRCHVSNVASRATLQKAGFLPCARIIRGVIAREATKRIAVRAP